MKKNFIFFLNEKEIYEILFIFIFQHDLFQGELTQDLKERARYLADTYNFDINHARKIWCFGPNTSGPNILVDVTQGINTSDIKDAVCAGFQWVSDEVTPGFIIVDFRVKKNSPYSPHCSLIWHLILRN